MTEILVRSGVPIIDAIFDLCVQILLWLAALFGVSYTAINVWIFCVIWPITTIMLVLIVVKQHRKIHKLKVALNWDET